MQPLKDVINNDSAIRKATNGVFLCPNHRYISVKNYRAVQSRDETSGLVIVVADLSYMLFNEPLPMFNPYTSQSNTNFFSKTTDFCTKNGDGDNSDATLPIE